MLNPNTRKNEI